jgi:PHD/YefM family antitoxin component YafN of YafNO toxin-antitoxin module
VKTPFGCGRFRPGPPSETKKTLRSRWGFCFCGLVTGCFELIDSAFNHTIDYTVSNAKQEFIMSTISANDLKTKGVKAIEEALATQPEVAVSVRGQVKYIVMSEEQYQYLRECEIEAALAESKADLDAGRYVKETVAQHIRRINKLNAKLAA